MYHSCLGEKNTYIIDSVPECLWINHIYHFLNIREIYIWNSVSKQLQRISNDIQHSKDNLITYLCNERHYLRNTTAQVLNIYLKDNHPTICLQDVIHMYTSLKEHFSLFNIHEHQLTLPMQTHFTYQTKTFDVGMHMCRILHRGLCVCTPDYIEWFDDVSSTTHKRSFDWLVFPPWELNHMCFTMWLPSEHDSTPPYITQLGGEPEDTICMTNYKQIYRVNMTSTQKEENICLGGAFESGIQNMTFLHYTYPYLIVSGQPLYYDTSSQYKCFGIWNIHERSSVLPLCSHAPSTFDSSVKREQKEVYNRCRLQGIHDYMFYECLFATPCGRYVYWKYHHSLFLLDMNTTKIKVHVKCVPFMNHFVQSIYVCRAKSVFAIYCGQQNHWFLYDLRTFEWIYSFKESYKTELFMYPFCSRFRFARKYGTKLVMQMISY